MSTQEYVSGFLRGRRRRGAKRPGVDVLYKKQRIDRDNDDNTVGLCHNTPSHKLKGVVISL